MQDAGAKLLDRIGKPVILLGHSQGGMLPPLITDARPHLVQAMILIEPQGPPFREVVFSNATSREWGLTDVPMVFHPEVTDPIKDLAPEQRGFNTPERVACVLQRASVSPVRKLLNLVSKPILVVTSESSYHTIYDHCTVDFLKQAGCGKSEHLYLADIGIKGNGHMMFMERNNNDIYNALQKWIDKI
jgi:pimeloyl-ACP methyl ester carboxylesterase